MRDEALVLVRRERRPHRVDEQLVELRALDELDSRLLELRQGVGSKLPIRLGLEVVVGERAVAVELLLVAELGVVADLDVTLWSWKMRIRRRVTAQKLLQPTSSRIAQGK